MLLYYTNCECLHFTPIYLNVIQLSTFYSLLYIITFDIIYMLTTLILLEPISAPGVSYHDSETNWIEIRSLPYVHVFPREMLTPGHKSNNKDYLREEDSWEKERLKRLGIPMQKFSLKQPFSSENYSYKGKMILLGKSQRDGRESSVEGDSKETILWWERCQVKKKCQVPGTVITWKLKILSDCSLNNTNFIVSY